ncbi:hypothetical protein ACLIBG_02355 [Virgibacillus sp. W0181]|uniref:hypothetical protein n=1 Tax=Virgibacillus sp. W0181 TaxID=3391581 RepID=UPI003F484B7F
MDKTIKERKWEVLLWSIALPGFGQLLNRKYVKGIILIGLEFVTNVMGRLNQVIIYSFHGEIEQAIASTNYQWVMFYPCLYFFAIWDAYQDAGGGRGAYAYLPLAITAFLTTVAVVFSSVFEVNGYLIGPIWLPIIATPLALFIGWIIKIIIVKMIRK